MPTVLVGTEVDGKANFLAIAWCGVACSQPPMVSVAIQPIRHSMKGIQQNLAFSVNVPSVDQVREADYCGIRSGSKVDKVDVCGFDLFYGTVEAAPMITQFPVNLECRVAHMLHLGTHWLIVGRVEETHVSDDCLTDGRPDVERIRPFIFATSPSARYYSYGENIARAFNVGLEMEK
jgi:flavin reductase (DIM6/NTAB) family NADH-FMN oxidoreductase RutF